MKIDSPLFDSIRVKPEDDRRARPSAAVCEWQGCVCEATHRAPKGRLREREYWRFCLEHVREYNQAYDYFAGMSDDAVARYQKDALTGHRPTWKMGVNGAKPKGEGSATRRRADDFFIATDGIDDFFGVFAELGGSASSGHHRADPEGRPVRNAERKALDMLGLESGASAADIKSRFKTLVKRHHPDANGGDRSSEDRLRDIIQAYNYLKSVGFC